MGSSCGPFFSGHANSARAVGIKVTPGYPEYATLVDDRGHARYDLLLGNDRQYSNTPWTYYQYIYQLPVLDNQTNTNYERYVNQKAWDMTKALDKAIEIQDLWLVEKTGGKSGEYRR